MLKLLTKIIVKPVPFASNTILKIRSMKTSASLPWANESAQRRRYEAVLETVPRTNSMVSII